MFYSHEVLTSRKYGVATVWLVATLGQRSSLRRVSRKAISEVNVTKACESIITPEAPMALRLKSNLLYGVARVYDQQCDYILTDAQHEKNRIMALFRVVRRAEVDSTTRRAKPDQILLPDDPTFLPTTTLEAFDFGLGFDNAALLHADESLLQSLSSHSSAMSGQLPAPLIFSESSFAAAGGFMAPDSATSNIPLDDTMMDLGGDDGILLPDFGFGIDEEGHLIARTPLPTREVRELPIGPGLSSEARRRVREEHAAAFEGGADLEPGLMDIDDPMMFLQPGIGMATSPLTEQPAVSPPTPSAMQSSPAIAPLRRRRRIPKALPLDSSIELRTRDLKDWLENYGQLMTNANAAKVAHQQPHQARKNAAFWIFGSGLNDIGRGIGASKAKSPLDAFVGDNLLLWTTGKVKSVIPQKRASSDEEEQAARRDPKRREDGSQLGRGAQDDGIMFMDDELEVPREAATELGDISATMPWNISASLRGSSVSRTAAGSVGGGSITRASSAGAARRRLASASPLVARSRMSEIEVQPRAEGAGMYDLSSDMPGFDDLGPLPASDFELHGPAAFVDTQTAAQASWQREALGQESENFLRFISNGVDGKQQAIEARGEEVEGPLAIEFEELLPTKGNSTVVAAQAFLHLLTLASRGVLHVEQDDHYGAISIRPA